MAEHQDMPASAWSDSQRAAHPQRRRSIWRAAVIGLGCSLLAATIAAPPAPRLVWNASASAPVGLYAVAPGARLARGDMAIVRPPARVRALADRRHYVPADIPLVKRVVAVRGARICAAGRRVTINGAFAATRRAADPAGRPLPWWTGCRTLAASELFVLMARAPDSFDGRYFGPSPARDVIGRATPLWLR